MIVSPRLKCQQREGFDGPSFLSGSAEEITAKIAGEKQNILPSREHDSSREISVTVRNGPVNAADHVRAQVAREEVQVSLEAL